MAATRMARISSEVDRPTRTALPERERTKEAAHSRLRAVPAEMA